MKKLTTSNMLAVVGKWQFSDLSGPYDAKGACEAYLN